MAILLFLLLLLAGGAAAALLGLRDALVDYPRAVPTRDGTASGAR